MMTFRPRSRAVNAYSRSRSGVRWAETMWTSCGMTRRVRISAACVRVGQSDWLPMMMPTSGAGLAISGDAVRNQPALQPGDFVAQHQLALFQPLQVQLVRRALVRQPRDNRIEVPMLAAQPVQFAEQRISIA